MTKEEKELLFKDLCTRLPYHVKCKIWIEDGTTEEGSLDLQYNYNDVLQDAFFYNRITCIKPYLRPMSSMTEKEEIEFNSLIENTSSYFERTLKELEWLNAHHFDYRGLIEKGLALEAPEGMY